MAEREINLDKRGLTNTVKSVGVITTFAVALGSAEQSPASAAEVQEALKNSPDPVVNDDSGEIEKREKAFQQTIVYSSGPSTDHPEQSEPNPETPDDPPANPTIFITPDISLTPVFDNTNVRAMPSTSSEIAEVVGPTDHKKPIAYTQRSDGLWYLIEGGNWMRHDTLFKPEDVELDLINLDKPPEDRRIAELINSFDGSDVFEKVHNAASEGINISELNRLLNGLIESGFPENTILDGDLEAHKFGSSYIVIQQNQVGLNPSGSVFVFTPATENGEILTDEEGRIGYNRFFYPPNAFYALTGSETLVVNSIQDGTIEYTNPKNGEVFVFDRARFESMVEESGTPNVDDFRSTFRKILTEEEYNFVDETERTIYDTLPEKLKKDVLSGIIAYNPDRLGYTRINPETGVEEVWRNNMTLENRIESGWLQEMDRYISEEHGTQIVLEMNPEEMLNNRLGRGFDTIKFTEEFTSRIDPWIEKHSPGLKNRTIHVQFVPRYEEDNDSNKEWDEKWLVTYALWNEFKSGPAIATKYEYSGKMEKVRVYLAPVDLIDKKYPEIGTEAMLSTAIHVALEAADKKMNGSNGTPGLTSTGSIKNLLPGHDGRNSIVEYTRLVDIELK